MSGTTKRVGEPTVYDEAEVQRRMGQIYTLLLELARERRARNQQASPASVDPAGNDSLV